MSNSLPRSCKVCIAVLVSLVLCTNAQVTPSDAMNSIPMFMPNTVAAVGVDGMNGANAAIDPLEFAPDAMAEPKFESQPLSVAPTTTPTISPVMTVQTPAPVVTPTLAPIATSTLAPVVTPTLAPVVSIVTPLPAATTPTASPTPTSAAPATERTCSPGSVQMSVENVTGVFCVEGPKICSGNMKKGNCPGIQVGLPEGSHCGVVYTGVFGCRPGPAPRQT